ncbi:hypothetical protein [Nocardia blacklockiae]|uniref:hypothetical protein n=1 Tax=Nocardia blacklockiae TaxID=480036 RepID=UPI001894CE0C|nr:hypothetical protein [Nocardia blacklockiae]MBF6173229.1 hypothetical protein [Nocardia blacklockiae]
MSDSTEKRIVVLADPGEITAGPKEIVNIQLPSKYHNNPPPSRYSFWKAIQLAAEDSKEALPAPVIYSVVTFPTSTDLYSNTKLLAISWDSANGDPLYRSDATLTYLRTQARVHIAELMKEGATVFIESQTAQSRPVQESYDAVLGAGELQVVTDWPSRATAHGRRTRRVRARKNHPVLRGLADPLDPDLNLCKTRPHEIFLNVPDELIPKANDGRARGGIRYDPRSGISESTWFGWFTWWGPDWAPLLYNDGPDSDKGPVLLAKVRDRGLILASTMWISASQTRLASRIAETALSEDLMREVRRHHRAAKRRRLAVDLLVGAAFLAGLILILTGLIAVARDNDRDWVLSVAGIGMVGTTVTAWQLFVQQIWRRPFGVPFYAAWTRSRRTKPRG